MRNELTTIEHRNFVILRQRTLKLVLTTILLLEETSWFSLRFTFERKTCVCTVCTLYVCMHAAGTVDYYEKSKFRNTKQSLLRF